MSPVPGEQFGEAIDRIRCFHAELIRRTGIEIDKRHLEAEASQKSFCRSPAGEFALGAGLHVTMRPGRRFDGAAGWPGILDLISILGRRFPGAVTTSMRIIRSHDLVSGQRLADRVSDQTFFKHKIQIRCRIEHRSDAPRGLDSVDQPCSAS